MFEDNKNASRPVPPSNLPTGGKEPEDILAGVEKTPSAASFVPPPRPVTSSSLKMGGIPTPPLPGPQLPEKKSSAKIFWLVIIIIILVGMGFGGWYWYSQLSGGSEAEIQLEEQPSEETFTPVENIEELNMAEEETPAVTTPETGNEETTLPPAEVPENLDTDGDGLTDEEEIQLGTDPSKVDTDGDDLFDREEARIYKTDPLNPDTDGDGYLDGQEIKSGYNPRGEGKLLEINL
ncbi:MAG: hypothetical protein PHD51_02640 [Patescibacteria group bacterium]|nr:hypothetical protein [Patescibacteria group bacterium]MDD5490244.1 hypothetical protein [Patescibacteria group bacterium]